jgi:hypothetical protein
MSVRGGGAFALLRCSIDRFTRQSGHVDWHASCTFRADVLGQKQMGLDSYHF